MKIKVFKKRKENECFVEAENFPTKSPENVVICLMVPETCALVIA